VIHGLGKEEVLVAIRGVENDVVVNANVIDIVV